MLYDKLDTAEARCEERIAEALAAAKTLPYSPGKTVISGDRLFVNGNEYETKVRDTQPFENHHAYIDVQVMLDGEEEIDVVLFPDATEEVPYGEQTDAAFSRFPRYTTLYMKKGDVAVFYPGEWHRPGMAAGDTPARVRKAVFKVAVGEDGKR